jgi:hypothetical protein
MLISWRQATGEAHEPFDTVRHQAAVPPERAKAGLNQGGLPRVQDDDTARGAGQLIG